MERRVQLLLDDARYDRLRREADRTGRSVNAVVREAIDLRFADDDYEVRAAAARRFLEMTADPGDGPPETIEEFRASMDEYLGRGLERFTDTP